MQLVHSRLIWAHLITTALACAQTLNEVESSIDIEGAAVFEGGHYQQHEYIDQRPPASKNNHVSPELYLTAMATAQDAAQTHLQVELPTLLALDRTKQVENEYGAHTGSDKHTKSQVNLLQQAIQNSAGKESRAAHYINLGGGAELVCLPTKSIDIKANSGSSENLTAEMDNFPPITTTVISTETPETEEAASTHTASTSTTDVHHRDPKSLKNRFNYASADCAAVALKANREAKGLTAILNSKKDQYMLNECAAKDKFVIVELCDDILIDTLVLGNYEFFSSTFKDVMVSVSDRYPPKNNTWTILGHFQARNSRDAQVFPVLDPKIWTRYIKFEFKSHYGREHYCPLTVLKVYGATQMEQYRKEEEEEDFAETATLTVDALAATPLLEYPLRFPYHRHHHHQQQLRIDGATGSPAKAYLADMQGLVNKYEERDDGEPQLARTQPPIPKVPNLPWDRRVNSDNSNSENVGKDEDGKHEAEEDEEEVEVEEEDYIEDIVEEERDRQQQKQLKEADTGNGSHVGIALNIDKQEPQQNGLPQANNGGPNSADQGESNSYAGSGSTAQPIANSRNQRGQESIFKTIMRRLSRVERNVTLAYHYLEEQHLIFNLVLQQVELNNLENVQLAIKQLNHSSAKQMQSLTTLSEEIWRAILYDLEEYQQKTQSEMGEMAKRLEFLAEEVLFEKRMNVAQLALLLIIVAMIAVNKVVTKLALIPESKKEK
ncbi:hypothetical protein GGI25_002168 [Coemansia spiralis]|uniref:SUN-like protein 1 n=2 Tax=Coemansia TaxID=4863 RepID=A0A9W8KZ94_9FUNG|nr:hypothetical protein EDC05_000067 [Coemansia umbellata]KAJ2626066.1 hypothetical protein GGI26_000150 [Coemansia sp. RSA 1358]KAJ2678580.1 hypothetical protein GGI25_002168 [Coemansia spiralis]